MPEQLPKLLFDENLAARLVAALADLYPGSAHITDVALAPAPDRAIWAHARDHGFVIVSKDEDFHRLSVLRGPPPKVIWIRLGNCSTDDVIRLRRLRRAEVETFMAHEEATPRFNMPFEVGMAVPPPRRSARHDWFVFEES